MNVRLQYVKQRYSIFHYSNETLYSNYIFDNRYYIEKQTTATQSSKEKAVTTSFHPYGADFCPME